MPNGATGPRPAAPNQAPDVAYETTRRTKRSHIGVVGSNRRANHTDSNTRARERINIQFNGGVRRSLSEVAPAG